MPDDWGNGWDNVWLGTSVGSQKSQARINHLLSVPKAKVRFLSIEPMHGLVDLTKVMEYQQGYSFRTNALTGRTYEWDANGKNGIYDHGFTDGNKLDWVIVGGESGNDKGLYRYRPCELDWIGTVVSQCKSANVAVFVKQLGTHLAKEGHLSDRHGGNIEEFPESLQVRQFPL